MASPFVFVHTFSSRTAVVAWKKANFSSAIRHCSKFNPLMGLSVQYPRNVKSSNTINSDGLVADAMILKME